jgi:outer membrane protein assembly factor BamB
MTDEYSDTCPECGSSELVADENEIVCSDCGLVVVDKTQTSDAPDSDQSESMWSEPDWPAGGQEQPEKRESGQSTEVPKWREELEEQRQERDQIREEQQAALDAASSIPVSWTVDNRRLIGSLKNLAILYDAAALYAVEIKSGNVVWEREIPDIIGDAALQDITHLSASYMDWRVILGESDLYVRLPSDKVLSLSAETGDTQWEYTPTSEHSGKSVLSETSMYLTNDYGAMAALSLEDGAVRWTADAQIETADWQSWFPAPPILLGDLVISATNSDDGLITARHRHTGEVKWQFALRETPSVLRPVQGQCLAGTVRGDVFAIDSDSGTQQWRHRLTEFGDPEDPGETTRPTEPVLGINYTNSCIMITGGGFYSSLVDPDDGTQLYELPSAGVAGFGDADSQFYHPASVTPDGMVYTFSHDFIQSYRLDEADTIDEAQEWGFETTDIIHTNPVLWEDEGYLITSDSRNRVCLLDASTGDPKYTCELDDSAEKFVPTQWGLLVDTKASTYSLEIQ